MDHQFLSNTVLFGGLNENEINSVLSCLGTREKSYKNGADIFSAGDSIDELGLVTRGSVVCEIEFYHGGSGVCRRIEAGDIFGEEYAPFPQNSLICKYKAAEDCSVLFLNYEKLTTVCENVCPFHQIMIKNLIKIISKKNAAQSLRMLHTSSKSTRARLISYFTEQAIKSGSVYFTVPYSRQELADYLGVERSALSNAISKMQNDGLIQYHKNEFKLLKPASHKRQ